MFSLLVYHTDPHKLGTLANVIGAHTIYMAKMDNGALEIWFEDQQDLDPQEYKDTLTELGQDLNTMGGYTFSIMEVF